MLHTPTRAALCLLFLLTACGDDSSPVDATLPMDDAALPPADAASDADLMDSGVTPAPDAAMADTWTGFAQTFFADYCVACHAGGTRDYRSMTEVMRDSSTIACGVSPTPRAGCTGFPPPGQFPVGSGPKPSDAERERLVAWIDAGLPE
ncbi:MAG: hypothetical protein GXP55_03045 [Deltaproteobacteria bacterium]|nr:hypothetical protein [Deltaproteobacteria bacterium]